MLISSPIRLAWITLSIRPLIIKQFHSSQLECSQSAPATLTRSISPHHLELTRSSPRQTDFISASIVEIRSLTSLVNSVKLKLSSDENVKFFAGQWCDFLIPQQSQPIIGGFSIASTPNLLRSQSIIELIVKCTRASASHWLHHVARVNDRVKIRIGGECFYNPEIDCDRNILLIAFGTGIARVRHQQSLNNELSVDVKTRLIHSVRSADDLLFRDEIELMGKNENFNYALVLTGGKNSSSLTNGEKNDWRSNPLNYSRRIDESLISQHLEANSLIFLCGSVTMIDEWKIRLRSMGIGESNIRTERW